MPYLICRPNCGSPSQPVIVEGTDGIIGEAVWNREHNCHALEIDDATYRKHMYALAEFLPKHDSIGILYRDDGKTLPPNGELARILDEFRNEGETDSQCVMRMISDAGRLQNWIPSRGAKPTTFLDRKLPVAA